MANINKPDYDELKSKLLQYSRFDNSLKQKLWVLGIITKALSYYNIKPILIGGCALEYYSLGGHNTYDIDIAVVDHARLEEVMDSFGFQKEGRFWQRDDLDIIIESPAGNLVNETAPLTEVRIEEFVCYIIGLEDLIIDRLNGYVHWKWEDDGRYVKLLLKTYSTKLDWNYLEKRAKDELTLNYLVEFMKDLNL